MVGNVFCKIINDRLVRYLESGGVLHEGQTGFRAKRSCVGLSAFRVLIVLRNHLMS